MRHRRKQPATLHHGSRFPRKISWLWMEIKLYLSTSWLWYQILRTIACKGALVEENMKNLATAYTRPMIEHSWWGMCDMYYPRPADMYMAFEMYIPVVLYLVLARLILIGTHSDRKLTSCWALNYLLRRTPINLLHDKDNKESWPKKRLSENLGPMQISILSRSKALAESWQVSRSSRILNRARNFWCHTYDTRLYWTRQPHLVEHLQMINKFIGRVKQVHNRPQLRDSDQIRYIRSQFSKRLSWCLLPSIIDLELPVPAPDRKNNTTRCCRSRKYDR